MFTGCKCFSDLCWTSAWWRFSPKRLSIWDLCQWCIKNCKIGMMYFSLISVLISPSLTQVPKTEVTVSFHQHKFWFEWIFRFSWKQNLLLQASHRFSYNSFGLATAHFPLLKNFSSSKHRKNMFSWTLQVDMEYLYSNN